MSEEGLPFERSPRKQAPGCGTKAGRRGTAAVGEEGAVVAGEKAVGNGV